MLLETALAILFDTHFPHKVCSLLTRRRRFAEEMPKQGVGIL